MKQIYSAAIFLVLILVALSSQDLRAATYHIDGSNGNDNKLGNMNSPWKTISKANSTLKAGDTVYIRAGSYSDRIRPVNSGTSGNQITFSAYSGETVTLTNSLCVDLGNRSYITINGFRTTSVSRFVVTDLDTEEPGNSHYNVISNNNISGTSSWGAISLYQNCTYWQIIGNTVTNGQGSGIHLMNSCSYNLIEGNTVSDIKDHDLLTVRSGSHYNVVRNNIFYTSGLLSDENRTDGMVMILLGADHNLFENNTFYETGSNYNDAKCNALKINNSDYNIIRRNIVRSVDQFAFLIYTNIWGGWTSDAKHNVFYNNTVYDVESGPSQNSEAALSQVLYDGGDDIAYNVWINNIVHKSGYYGINSGGDSAKTYGNTWMNNNLYDIASSDVRYFGASGTIPYMETNYPSTFMNNVSVDSKFTDAANGDFTLQSDSPLIDAGGWLTTVTSSSGSGTSFTVANVTFFMDGFGIVAGDTVQIESQSTTARITDISYETNTITVDKSLSWTQGDGISLQYYGSGLDMGAHEYSNISVRIDAPVGLKVVIQ